MAGTENTVRTESPDKPERKQVDKAKDKWECCRRQWLEEESVAHIHGWDFSHIHGRYEEEEDLPWDYEEAVRGFLRPTDRLLDMDTGGGEFLLSLGHAPQRTAATEGYPPNADLCRRRLVPLGIDFREAADMSRLPFENAAFDMVINRHGDMDAEELARIVRPGGVFVTEQVGAHNDRELVELLLPGEEEPFSDWDLAHCGQGLADVGFDILRAEEAYRPIRFYDVGALVWFARIIEWEFPGFSVDRCFDRLCQAQRILEEKGVLEGQIHRFLIVARRGQS